MSKDKPHYYVKDPSRDDRSITARVLDFVLLLLFMWLCSALLVQLLPLEKVVSLILTVTTILLVTFTVTWMYIRKRREHKIHRDTWYSARKCREKIKAITSKKEFATLVQEILTSTLPVEGLKLLVPAGNSSIDLSGYIRSRKLGVLCLNPDKENDKTTAEEIKKFVFAIRAAGFDHGIVITSGSFSEDARRFAKRIRGRARIHLIDGTALVRLARRAGHPVFQNEKWREDREQGISGIDMALSIKEDIMASRKKSFSFILLGLIFVLISTRLEGILGPAYLTFGIINMFIGFSGIILSYLRKQEMLLDWL